MPPECLTCVVMRAGSAPHPALTNPHDRALQPDEVMRMIRDVRSAGISLVRDQRQCEKVQ